MFRASNEVLKSLRSRKPIVCLESAIVSHGLPFPQNLETQLSLEAKVRSFNCTPATICIANGYINIGSDLDLLHALASQKNIIKTSSRDISRVLADDSLIGSTTVASTLVAASLFGDGDIIKIFVTGGIGGVHRGAQQTMDVSADLHELSRRKIAVVCAGAKSILDIGLTLEVLETLGVPVCTFFNDDFLEKFNLNQHLVSTESEKARFNQPLLFTESEKARFNQPLLFTESEKARFNQPLLFTESEKARFNQPLLFTESQKARFNQPLLFTESEKARFNQPLLFTESEKAKFNQTNQLPKYFPAFYTRNSGFDSQVGFNCPKSVAKLIYTQQNVIKNGAGVLVGVPIPKQHEYPHPKELESAILDAISEAESKKITGKNVTPFILDKLAKITAGTSIEANKHLIHNNVIAGCRIAIELATFELLEQKSNPNLAAIKERKIDDLVRNLEKTSIERQNNSSEERNDNDGTQTLQNVSKDKRAGVVIIGGAVVDISSTVTAKKSLTIQQQTMDKSVPGIITETFGGVARNMAEACARILATPSHLRFVSIVGQDFAGKSMVEHLKSLGVDTTNVQELEMSDLSVAGNTTESNKEIAKISKRMPGTAKYNSIFGSDGQALVHGVIDATCLDFFNHDRLEKIISPSLNKNEHNSKGFIETNAAEDMKPKVVAFDANFSPKVLHEIIKTATFSSASFSKDRPLLVYEPTTMSKSCKIFETIADKPTLFSLLKNVDFITPNSAELLTMANHASTAFQIKPKRVLALACDKDSQKGENENINDGEKANFLKQNEIEALGILLQIFPNVICKLGSRGVVHGFQLQDDSNIVNNFNYTCYQAGKIEPESILTETGAGDTFTGAFVGLLASEDIQGPKYARCVLDKCIRTSMRAAEMSLQCIDAVSPNIGQLNK